MDTFSQKFGLIQETLIDALVHFEGFYRVTACNATHSIAVAILSVRLSVRRVYCDKTK